MEIYEGIITGVNRETYEIYVRVIGKDDYPVNVIPMSTTPMDPIAGGINSLPLKETRCLVLHRGAEYYLLGYYNEPHGGSYSGYIANPESQPLIPIDTGDTIHRHRAGNYTHLGRGWYGNYQGVGAYYKLVGNEENSSWLFSHRIIMEMPGGLFAWSVLNENVANVTTGLNWKIKKSFEFDDSVQLSDYVEIRAGSIPKTDGNGGYESHTFDIDVVQYDGALTQITDTFFSLSKNDNNQHWQLNTDDFLTQAHTYINNTNAYNTKISVMDNNQRTAVVDLMPDNYYLSLIFDDNYNFYVDNNGNITESNTGNIKHTTSGDAEYNFEGKYFKVIDGKMSVVCDDINWAEETGAEPVVRGTTLVQILTEFVGIYNAHLHPTGTGPSGPPAPPNQWNPNFNPALSQKVRTS